MLYKICLILTCSLLLAGCRTGGSLPSKGTKAANAFLATAHSNLAKKYRARFVGTHAAAPNETVNQLGLRFHLTGFYSVEDLREILIESLQDFQELVNSDLQLRPFLESYPFKIDNLEITFFLVDEMKQMMPYPSLGRARIRNGQLYYDFFTSVDGVRTRRQALRESYEEALRALEKTPYMKKFDSKFFAMR